MDPIGAAPQALVGLVMALIGLLVGPFAHSLLGPTARLRALIDGLALVVVLGLCVLELLPHALADGGLWAVAVIALAVLAPVLLHRLPQGRRSVVGLLGVALLLHELIDGAALAVGAARFDADDHGMALAIISHRLPVGFLVFAAVRSGWGKVAAWGAIGAMSLATVAGFVLGPPLAAEAPVGLSWVLQAAVAGALLHIAMHVPGPDAPPAALAPAAPPSTARRLTGVRVVSAAARGAPLRPPSPTAVNECRADCGHDHSHAGHGHVHKGGSEPEHPGPVGQRAARAWAFVGSILGLAVLTASLASHPAESQVRHTLEVLLDLSLESAPALLLGYLLAGLVTLLLSPARAAQLGQGGAFAQALRGLLFGLPLPICSCGVLPLYSSLVRRGVPATAALTFLVATPELGLDALLLSFPLLGAHVTLARLAGAATVAVAVGMLVGPYVARLAPPPRPTVEPPTPPLTERLRAAMRFGFVEVLDHTLPWVGAGLILAALAEPLLAHEGLAGLPSWAQVPLFALLGVPIYVCATGATPLAAVAIHQGISPGAALAFLLAGPATNTTTFGVLTALHGRKVAALTALVITLGAVLSGWAVDALIPVIPVSAHPGGEHLDHHGPAWLALAAVVLLGLWSAWRQGPRGIVEQIRSPTHAHG